MIVYINVQYFRTAENKQAVAPRFIFECAIKLNMKPLTCATAAVIFHRFYKEVGRAEYDEFVNIFFL